MWPPLIERVSNLKMENSIDPSIPFTALRTIVVNLPRPVPGVPSLENVQRAYEAISRVLVVRLVGYIIIPHGKKNAPTPPPGLLRPQESKGAESDALDVLIELIRCFGPMLQQPEIQALQTAVMDIMENDQTSSVVRKKAVAATSVLAVHFTDDVLSHTVSLLIENLNDPHLTPARRRLFLTLIGAMARSIPLRYGPYLETLAPFILSALSETEYQDQMEKTAEDMEPDMELDEVREAALITLESCLGTCSNTMSEFTEETIQGALRFLKYDPYFSGDNEDDEMDDMDDDGTNGYEDDEEDVFEEEAAFSDDDDVSWKIRRCAAKALYTLISTRASSDLLEDGTLYERIAPKLIARFNEREENVVLEILSTMSLLIRRTGQERTTTRVQSNDLSQGSFMGPPPSRKRRRGGSDVSMFDTQASVATVISPPGSPSAASSGPRASLAALTPLIVTSSTKLLDGKSLSTKQAAVTLLKDLVIVQHGGLSDHFAEIIRSISEASISSHSGAISAVSSSSSSSATGSTLRIEALQLMATLCETHSSAALRPYLDQMVPNVLDATKDKFYKISSEGLNALEQVIKVLTPPRWITPDDEQKKYISTTYDAVIDQITANDADVEVRHRAIHALGVLLSRTSGPDGPQLLSPSLRSKALEVLQTRLKSEITRLAAVKAIDSVALLAVDKAEFDPKWIQSVSLELGAQLRKSNRALRGSSLAALKDIVINPAGCDNLDVPTVKELITILMQLMDASDLLLLGPTLVILAKLVQANGKSVVSPAISEGICKLVLSPLRGSVLDALLLLTTALGESGTGNVLMTGLLQDVGVRGDPAIVGKVIGTLLVSGGPNIGVKTEDFTRELRSAEDDQRTCLALAVLGEAGLRLESKSPLGPETFSAHFDSKSDRVPLAAAIALGRAGAGNTSKFLPVILREMKTSGSSQYLLLHSINEILQQAHDSDDIGITEYLQPLWEKLLDTAKSEDNKAVGAECIGRLALIDPKTYYPSLQVSLVLRSIRFSDKRSGRSRRQRSSDKGNGHPSF
jgi:cullin-associated NEDD8-dissociated protein 1